MQSQLPPSVAPQLVAAQQSDDSGGQIASAVAIANIQTALAHTSFL